MASATIRGGRTAAPALLVLAVVVLAPPGAGAALSCSTVYNRLMPCLGYVQSGGVVPPACCEGLKKLVSSTARSAPDRRAICTCLGYVGAGAEGGPYRSRAAGLPGRCNAPPPYETWPTFNCDSIN
uniref:Uncharacterized protein n=1 Tax=Avena sativa TaxID=4498 RepID=A0ACD5WBQ1_AVESA